MHNLFIINPKAGKRNFINKLIKDIETYFTNHIEDTYEIKVCEHREETTSYAKQEAQKGKEVRIFAWSSSFSHSTS